MQIKYAAEIFRGYTKYASSYGDIIKHLLANCRDISKVNTAKTIALCLQREFHAVNMTLNMNRTLTEDSITSETNETNNRIDRTAPEYQGLKELAHKFCLSFGPEASVKSRDAILAIHQEAIRYATENNTDRNQQKAPPNLPFLDVIIEFSSRLTTQDKKTILAELDKTFAKHANKIDSNNWMPYYSYRISLMDDAASSSASSSTTSTAYQNNVLNATDANRNTNRVNNTSSLNNKSNLMPAPLYPVNGSLTKSSQRKRRQVNTSNSSNISGISILKESLVEEKTKKSKKLVPLEEAREESEDDENENLNEAETTSTELESLKISTINHNETARADRVATRSSNRLNTNTPTKNLNTNNKRSRSPLTTNNSINESTDQFNILTSTRIESKMINKKNGTKQKTSVSITSMTRSKTNGNGKNNTDDDEEAENEEDREDADDSEDFEDENEKHDADILPMSKRKRKSEENNDDTLINLSGNKSVLAV